MAAAAAALLRRRVVVARGVLAVRVAVARRAAVGVAERAVRRRVVARAGVVRVVVRRRAELVRAVVRRVRVAGRAAVVRRVAVRRAGLRPARAGAGLWLTAASSFFSISTRRFSNALSWVVMVRFNVAALAGVRVARLAVVRLAVVRRTPVRVAVLRLALGLRVVLAAARAGLRLALVLRGVRGIDWIPPFGLRGTNLHLGAPKSRLIVGYYRGCACDVDEDVPNRVSARVR
ncbi:MAG: hypothetical protein ACRENY_08150 [Candidatus Dormibacteria bacterium]